MGRSSKYIRMTKMFTHGLCLSGVFLSKYYSVGKYKVKSEIIQIFPKAVQQKIKLGITEKCKKFISGYQVCEPKSKEKGYKMTSLSYELLQLRNVKLLRFYSSRHLWKPYLIKSNQKIDVKNMEFHQWHFKILANILSTRYLSKSYINWTPPFATNAAPAYTV